LSTLHTNNAATTLPRLLDMGIEPFLIASTVNTVIGQRLVRKLCQNCRVAYIPEGKEIEDIKHDFELDAALKHYKEMTEGKNGTPAAPAPKPAEQKVSDEPEHKKEKLIVPSETLESKSILDKIAADPNIINRSAAEAKPAASAAVAIAEPAPTATPTVDPSKLKSGQFMVYRAGAGCEQCGGLGYRGRMGIYEVLENETTISKMIVSRATSEDIQEEAVRNGMLTMQQDGFVKVLMGLTSIEEVLRVTRE
jgi:type II secretory ATPase GspE/PulE/Tfp pilus assembly ATPase PilB-like protein